MRYQTLIVRSNLNYYILYIEATFVLLRYLRLNLSLYRTIRLKILITLAASALHQMANS